ncbi:MAG: membrane dipeptidase [Sphaerochaetaceae bacterium]|nr:membrane dipeptidase [Sphaerochaetaceae bacterium]MDC7237424.1 membrane dipeptidase [Sphaerochaetaceae bacterium]
MKIVDMHCDTIVEMFNTNQHISKNNLHIDLEKMKRSDYLLQNMAIFLDCRKVEKIDKVARDIIHFYNKETSLNNINKVYKYSDIKMDKINSMLTIEDSAIVPFKDLNEFYELGVRMITLTWNYINKVGYPNLDGDNLNTIKDLRRVDNINGLTVHGIDYIKKMEELNMIIDISHGSNKLVEDVLNNTSKPFVASHSNYYSVTNVGRNLNDNLLRKMIERECVIGINFCSEFISDRSDKVSTISDIIKHIDYMIDLGGENSIGFGADLDGINSKLEIKDSGNMQEIVRVLEKRYSKSIVKKICSENVLSLYEKVLQ